MFQFHKGSIKTSFPVQCLDINASFNSIKVRLRPKYNTSTYFDTKFQFHKGSIKTVRSSYVLRILLCFNSIKVRLRQDGCYVHQIETRLFQFHKGSIKTPKTHELVGYITVSIP